MPAVSREPGVAAVAFLGAHLLLGPLIYQSPALATLHALLTLGFGLRWIRGGADLPKVAAIAAYAAGSEVLWRMSSARLPWEYGKYAVVLLLAASLFRRRLRLAPVALTYFLLLLPSAVLTIGAFGLLGSRKPLSFNLSGPLAVMICASFFSHVTFRSWELRRFLLAGVGPVMAVGTVTLYATLSAGHIDFTGESNNVTSGGFGPNQVSATLAAGVLLALLYLLMGVGKPLTKWALLGGSAFLAVQSAMTFSRGGLVFTACSLLLGSLFLARDRRARFRLIGLVFVFLLAGKYVVLPRLNTFTGGALTDRFRDMGTTHRDELAKSDLEMWANNPVFGVGPGMGGRIRGNAAHTEFTRLLAEHGLFGMVAMVLMLLFCARNVLRGNTPREKAIVAAFVAWGVLFLAGYGFRIVVPALLLGLAFAAYSLEEDGRSASTP